MKYRQCDSCGLFIEYETSPSNLLKIKFHHAFIGTFSSDICFNCSEEFEIFYEKFVKIKNTFCRESWGIDKNSFREDKGVLYAGDGSGNSRVIPISKDSWGEL